MNKLLWKNNKNSLTGLKLPPAEHVQLETILHQLDNLPRANLAKSAEILEGLCQQLDTRSYSPAALPIVLAPLSQAIHYTCNMLNAQCLENSNIHFRKKRSIATFAQNLHLKAIRQYFKLLTEASYSEKHWALMCGACLQHVRVYLLRSYQQYQVPKAECYQMCYALFRHFNMKNLNHLSVSLPDQDTMTLQTIFNTVVLLLTCSPYQLIPQDLEKIDKHLNEWAKLCEIDTQLQDNALFVIKLDSAEPPSYQKLLSDDEITDEIVSIDLSAIVTSLQYHLAEKNYKNGFVTNSTELSDILINHLIHTWKNFPTRQFTRNWVNGKMRACVGMANIYYFLNDNETLTFTPNKTSRNKITTTQSSHTPNDEAYQAPEKRTWITAETSTPERPYLRSHQIEGPAPESHTWELLNTSANGYCLCTTADYPDDLKAGRIVGIQELVDERTPYWCIGVIRWIKFTEEDELQVGVELLAPNAMAVGVQNKDQKDNHYKLLRALLLPEIPALDQPKTLIVPTVPYNQGDSVRVANRHIDIDANLTECLNKSNFFKRFSFDVVEHFCDENHIFE